ncbi:MAG TPA: ferredoxin [Acidimicrobiales bacterium]|nr:ferredoxin [Acidimicrobiales bacterium]
MRLEIDAERCPGHGRCWDLAPLLVAGDDLGRGVARGEGTVPPEQEATARAARACPERTVVVHG